MSWRSRKRTGRDRRSECLAAYGFLFPNIVGFVLFTLGPVIASLALSLCHWDLVSGLKGISCAGLSNYGQIAHDREFWYYSLNTLIFMLVIPISMAGSLFLAVLLNQKLRGVTVYRTAFFLPSMCVPVAVFLLWRWILNGDSGLVNRILDMVGIQGPDWLRTTGWARVSIMASGLWMSIGGANMVLYLAGLQGVPRELHEAAEIDGASPAQRFFAVTWPMLYPTTFFILITSIIGGIQGNFEGPYMMTKGGPAGATTSIMYYIYRNAFEYFRMGYAAAIAWVLFGVILVLTLTSWRLTEGRMGYR